MGARERPAAPARAPARAWVNSLIKRTALVGILLALGLGLLPAQEPGSEGPALNIYPSFHLRFALEGRNYLVASLVVLNVSGVEVRNLTIVQTFPDNLVASAAPEWVHEYTTHAEGYAETLEGNTFTMKVPVLRKREVLNGFVLLGYKGRPNEASIPPATAEYTALNTPRTQSGPPVLIEIGKYTKYSGSLADFLKRFAGLQMRFPEAGAFDWGFTALASRARAKTPIGMVEIEGDATEGRFSLGSGAPGDLQEMIVSWRPAASAKPTGTPEEMRRILHDQVHAAVDFTFAAEGEGATIEKERLARGEAWTLSTRWKDRVPGRLGEGPMRWWVYLDPEKKTQYVFMVRAQGRGAGAGKSDVPNPEKEAALMKDLEGIVRSFRPL